MPFRALAQAVYFHNRGEQERGLGNAKSPGSQPLAAEAPREL